VVCLTFGWSFHGLLLLLLMMMMMMMMMIVLLLLLLLLLLMLVMLQRPKSRIEDDEVSSAGADFGAVVESVGVGIAATFAVAKTLNPSVLSKNFVVFLTMGTYVGWSGLGGEEGGGYTDDREEMDLPPFEHVCLL
jgi:hypothetical protein